MLRGSPDLQTVVNRFDVNGVGIGQRVCVDFTAPFTETTNDKGNIYAYPPSCNIRHIAKALEYDVNAKGKLFKKKKDLVLREARPLVENRKQWVRFWQDNAKFTPQLFTDNFCDGAAGKLTDAAHQNPNLTYQVHAYVRGYEPSMATKLAAAHAYHGPYAIFGRYSYPSFLFRDHALGFVASGCFNKFLAKPDPVVDRELQLQQDFIDNINLTRHRVSQGMADRAVRSLVRLVRKHYDLGYPCRFPCDLLLRKCSGGVLDDKSARVLDALPARARGLLLEKFYVEKRPLYFSSAPTIEAKEEQLPKILSEWDDDTWEARNTAFASEGFVTALHWREGWSMTFDREGPVKVQQYHPSIPDIWQRLEAEYQSDKLFTIRTLDGRRFAFKSAHEDCPRDTARAPATCTEPRRRLGTAPASPSRSKPTIPENESAPHDSDRGVPGDAEHTEAGEPAVRGRTFSLLAENGGSSQRSAVSDERTTQRASVELTHNGAKRRRLHAPPPP